MASLRTLNFFDLGMNKGDVTQMFIDIMNELKIENYKVYGFEPDAKWYYHCKDRFKSNFNVEVFIQAISDRKGTEWLFHAPNGVGHSIYESKSNIDKNKCVEIQTIRFSDFIKEIKEIEQHNNIVKINIEGAEYNFIKDFCENGVYDYVDLLIGSDDDINKIDLTNYQLQFYDNLKSEYGIHIERFSDYQPEKNFPLKDWIQKYT